MPENKSSRVLQRPSMEARSFAARSLRTSESRVTMRRRLASMRVGTRRRRYQRIDSEDRRLLDLSGPNSEPSGYGNRQKQSKTVEVNP
jgi:hypothetical protein